MNMQQQREKKSKHVYQMVVQWSNEAAFNVYGSQSVKKVFPTEHDQQFRGPVSSIPKFRSLFSSHHTYVLSVNILIIQKGLFPRMIRFE